ncbi:hypothetical protein F3Y22_tig00110814pilonHSYRG00159 [Hibiscus syriacus]|uniref:DUF7910 domain-containing protein n=1 Tax=Hibiscus syriacus TaxID=106335 RepID=A0A6A2ZN25_HIBSY|nr:hypothetical protein F3Y22_tig00110814pilonHSYRG00159 [Hibiscus syriacus]
MRWNSSSVLSTKLNKYLCAENGGGTVVVANRPSPSDWETFSGGVEAVSNTPTGLETFQIVRKDDDLSRVRFQASMACSYRHNRRRWIIGILTSPKKISSSSAKGLSAVRIPVGWWIAQDPTPPPPFVGGSSKALDNAFTWAEKYGLKVIVDLHAVKASQNGNLNVEYNSLTDGGRPVHNKCICDPIGSIGNADPRELYSLAVSMNRVAIDVHYYNLFSDNFRSLTPQQNIDYINTQRASDLGRLISNGEWTGEFDRDDASMEDYKRFVKAQMDVYGAATFGWAYWSYKCEENHWSLKWMIENNFINLQ